MVALSQVRIKPVQTNSANVTRLSPNTVSCQACDVFDGCLVEQISSNHEQPDRTSNSNRGISAGEHIFREGDTFSNICVVRSGSIKSYLISSDGEEQVLDFHLPGEVFGLDGSSLRGHMSSAATLETSTVCKLPMADVDDSGISQKLIHLGARQLERDHNLVLILARKDADGRLASFLCDLSRRYKSRGYSAQAINLSMSRQDIGNYLGLAVETVSRTLTRFQESGLISVYRRAVEIHDLKNLKNVAGAQAW